MTRPSHVSEALASFPNVESVVHVASLLGPIGVTPLDLERTNVDGTRTLIEACVDAGVSTFILTSSAAAVVSAESNRKVQTGVESELRYPRTFVETYGKSKMLQEEIVLNPKFTSAMNVVCLRPSIVYGENDKKLADRLVLGKDNFVLGAGETVNDFVDVDSVARAHVLCESTLAKRNGLFLDDTRCPRVFAVGGGRPTKLIDFFSGWTSKSPTPVPVFLGRLSARINEWCFTFFKIAPFGVWLYVESVDLLTMEWWYPVDNASKAFGWTPTPHAEIKKEMMLKHQKKKISS